MAAQEDSRRDTWTLIAYGGTFVIGALYFVLALDSLSWRTVVAHLLVGPFKEPMVAVLPFCSLALFASWALRKRWWDIALGCAAIAVWLCAGAAFCGLRVT